MKVYRIVVFPAPSRPTMTSRISRSVCEYIQLVSGPLYPYEERAVPESRQKECFPLSTGGYFELATAIFWGKDNLNSIWVGEAASHTLFGHVWRDTAIW
jgi:hypothetical protein